ncbi:hypothetical protein D3C80_1675850 [compost metagenome]
MQCRVIGKSLQGQQLGTAGTAQAPGLFEHTAAQVALGVQAARDVVVAPRGDETGEVLLGSLLVGDRLIDGQAHVVFQW